MDSLTYLGTRIHSNWDHSFEIRHRIACARAAFNKIRKVLCSHDLNFELKTRLLRCYVFSVLLYGVESWTLTVASMNKLEAFEMWTYRRILRISWVSRVRNEDVLYCMHKETEILKTVKMHKLSYLGHVMRHPEKYELPILILQGKIAGKRGVGRRRISWLKNLRQWFNTNTTGLFRAAVNKPT